MRFVLAGYGHAVERRSRSQTWDVERRSRSQTWDVERRSRSQA
jgi:hypothetical protein